MKLNLNNKLKLISLMPILLVFGITSYMLYDTYGAFNTARDVQHKLQQNRLLNEIVTNIARERGMSAIFLGEINDKTYKSLHEQRKVVDEKITNLLTYLQGSIELSDDSSLSQEVSDTMTSLRLLRTQIDQNAIDFNEAFDTYIKLQDSSIKQLQKITTIKADKQISRLYSTYITLVNAKEASGIERAFISNILSANKPIDETKLNQWISYIARADTYNYNDIAEKDIVQKLDSVFKSSDAKELLEDLNINRVDIISKSATGDFDIAPGVWFGMISEKIDLLTKSENILLDEMDARSNNVQKDSLELLILVLTIWLVTIIIAIIGYFLSREIQNNIKHLEVVLRKVSEDYDSKSRKIDLATSEGTDEAYALLEEVIEQTKKDKKFAQEANEAKSMFLANMSHEIRTPLNGIVGFTELLKDSGLREDQSEFVEIIEKSSENLLEIINNILDLSKIESNKLELEHISFNPMVEFESAVDVYAVRASEKNINLGCFIDPMLESPLKGDPTKLKEVLINLLSNAVKFTNSGGSINVNIRKEQADELGKIRVRFEVQDSGIGVTSDQRTKIFEAFSQADSSITRKYGGTGLGLTISSSFIELMGGKLDLHSVVGEGTTFFFVLDFEEIQTNEHSLKNSFSFIDAYIYTLPDKIKSQDGYLREYLNFYGIKYHNFEDISSQKFNDNANNLIFVDFDSVGEAKLQEICESKYPVVVLTKSNMLKRVESLGLDIYKVLYEPIHNSKLKAVFENLEQSKTAKIEKKKVAKVFEAGSSKILANVLVAEDNTINQKLIKRTLEDLGLSVTIASNGLEAFQKRKDGNFDLIFMDIQMPFLDGIEATAEILEWEMDYHQPHIPIIALTANALKGDRERFLSAGLDEYTTKPLVRSQIISLLNRYLGDKIVELEDDKESVEVEFATPSLDEQEDSVQLVDTLQESEDEKLESNRRADILFAKKSAFEIKLYTKLLDSINGLTYEVASSVVDFLDLIANQSYAIVLFDKEYYEDIEVISKIIREHDEKSKNKTAIVLMDDSLDKDASMHSNLVDEVLPNTINRDLIKSLFIKYL